MPYIIKKLFKNLPSINMTQFLGNCKSIKLVKKFELREISDENLSLLFRFIDANNSNSISISEMKLMFPKLLSKQAKFQLSDSLKKKFEAFFKSIDSDNSGHIDQTEFQKAFLKIGLVPSQMDMENYYNLIGLSINDPIDMHNVKFINFLIISSATSWENFITISYYKQIIW